jgi:3-dehydroquinate dehydratase
MQSARTAIAHTHAIALAHVLFTVRSKGEGGLCPPEHVLGLLMLGFRMGCEIVDIEASMLAHTRSALLEWLQHHFSTSPPCAHVSAVLSSVHVMNSSVSLHDDHICARSLAVAAARSPAPHALKFAAVLADDVSNARMQQQASNAQHYFGLPVCCVAIAGEGAGRSAIAAISRLHCATLTFCRPMSSAAPTALGSCPTKKNQILHTAQLHPGKNDN